MPLRFRGADLRPILTEAIDNRCLIVLVKDQGVYFLAERGARRPDGRQALIAYAVGCNPDVDPFDVWWERADELGGDDFAECFDPQARIFESVRSGSGDLELTATETELTLQVVAAETKP